MGSIVNALICVPFGAVLRWIYQLIGSYGVSIIIFTILTKLVILPFTLKSKRGMMEMQRLQPKVKELEKKYAATNRAKYQEEVSLLYEKEGVSPMSGCLPLLFTFPIMIGLYYVIQRPLTFIMGLVPEEIALIAEKLSIALPENSAQIGQMEISIANEAFHHFSELSSISPNLLPIDFNFLGINLAATPQWTQLNLLLLIPVLSGLTAFLLNIVTTKLQQKASGGPVENSQNTTLNVMMPLISVWFGFMLPAGVGLYWIVSNLAMMLQEVIISHFLIKENAKKQAIREKEEAARAKARREIEELNRLENQARQREQAEQARLEREKAERAKSKGGKK